MAYCEGPKRYSIIPCIMKDALLSPACETRTHAYEPHARKHLTMHCIYGRAQRDESARHTSAHARAHGCGATSWTVCARFLSQPRAADTLLPQCTRCVCARSGAEPMIYVDSQQTLVLAGVGMDGAAPSAPTFPRFAKGVSAAIMNHYGIEVRRDRRGS